MLDTESTACSFWSPEAPALPWKGRKDTGTSIVESSQRHYTRLAALPKGFIVEGNKEPLKEGELERAAGWAKGVLESKK